MPQGTYKRCQTKGCRKKVKNYGRCPSCLAFYEARLEDANPTITLIVESVLRKHGLIQ